MQEYMRSNVLSSEEMSPLDNLRANTVNGYKMCFPNAFQNDKTCKLGCNEEDTIAHAYSCHIINIHETRSIINYLYVFSDIMDQKKAVKVFIKRNTIRSAILEAALPTRTVYWARALQLLLEVLGRGFGICYQ